MKERVEQVRQQRDDGRPRPRPAADADGRHRRLHERRASRPCSTPSSAARSRWPRTSCSRRSTRRAARSSSATARPRSSPTRSGSSTSCPHQLVDAFRATLEEVNRADVLVEVVDAADAALRRAPGDRPDRPRRARRRRQAAARRLQQGGSRRRRPRATAARPPRSSRGPCRSAPLTGFGLDTLRAETRRAPRLALGRRRRRPAVRGGRAPGAGPRAGHGRASTTRRCAFTSAAGSRRPLAGELEAVAGAGGASLTGLSPCAAASGAGVGRRSPTASSSSGRWPTGGAAGAGAR